MMNPNDILFSLATICDPIPSVVPVISTAEHRTLAEDDWRQIEFIAVANRNYIESKISELAAFRESHRKGIGFTSIFVRPEHPVELASLHLVTKELVPNHQPSLLLGEGSVPGGFYFADESGWFIYGQQSNDGKLCHLAVSPSHDRPASAGFCRLLSTIAHAQLILVDWYAGEIIDTSSFESIQTWTQRYQ